MDFVVKDNYFDSFLIEDVTKIIETDDKLYIFSSKILTPFIFEKNQCTISVVFL